MLEDPIKAIIATQKVSIDTNKTITYVGFFEGHIALLKSSSMKIK